MSGMGASSSRSSCRRSWRLTGWAIGLAYASLVNAGDLSPSTRIATEYLGTVVAPLDAPQVINPNFQIYNVAPGGTFSGPRITAKTAAPCADWLKILPSGTVRLDIRCTFITNDGAIIYTSYNGVQQHTKESLERVMKGDLMKAGDYYFIVTPTFETSSEKYAWLNGIQVVGKMASLKLGEGSHIKLDFFIVR